MTASEPKELAVQPTERDRTKFIGGSDAAAILGVSPWRTLYQLWEEKVGISERDINPDRLKVLNRGKRLEPVVMEMLQDEHDIAVTDRNVIMVDAEFPFLACEIDFQYVDAEMGVCNGDVKTVHPFAAGDWGDEGTDQIPVYYVAQFQHGMMISGAKACLVVALIGADDLRIYIVARDEELIELIRAKSVAFWNDFVLPRIPPPVTTSEDAARAIRKFNGVSVTASPEMRETIAGLKTLKAQVKVLEADIEAAEAKIKITLSSATDEVTENKFAIVGEDGKPLLTWNPQSTSRIDSNLVKTLHPEIVSEVTSTTTFRVLRIK